MTLVVSWVGIDSRKISSLNIASDSRISWGAAAKFDQGRKVFGCKNHPVIMGYCGDVLFPSIVLNQLVEMADQGMLFDGNESGQARFEIFFNKVTEQFGSYPSDVEGTTSDSLQILFATRDGETEFLCRKMSWHQTTNTWHVDEHQFSLFSDKIFVIGSGKTKFEERFDEFRKSNEARTSRGVFQCFCETLEENAIPDVGGSPQLVSLYNRYNARQFGIIHENERYFNGVLITNKSDFDKIEWRNKLFEICDGNTKEIKSGAQRQPRRHN